MSRRGWVLFVAMSVIWGVPYLLIKVADGGVAVPVLVLARVGIGAALLLPLAVRQGRWAPCARTGAGWARSRWWRSLCRGCCCPRPSASCPAR